MKVFETNKKILIGTEASHVQTISHKNIAKATYFLRDKIYSDKLKAAITETLTNAIDEHRKHKVARPVDVFIFDTELVIRDYAAGLSEEKVFGIFFQYFESTKSNNDYDIGGFGIGAKAPGAYSSEYYVNSYYNGKKTSYCSIVDGYESKASKVFEAPTDANNTGIAVRIPFPETSSADKTSANDILHDLFVQIGYDKEPEFNVYAMAMEDYDEFESKVNSGNIAWNATTKTWHKGTPSQAAPHILTHTTTWKYHRACFRGIFSEKPVVKTFIKNGKAEFNIMTLNEEKKPYTINIDDDVLLCRGYFDRYNSSTDNNIFKYSFWKNNVSMLAYDGDICYKVDYDTNKVQVDNAAKVIIFFRRGELPITPSRESIEKIDRVTGYISNKLENAYYSYRVAMQQAYAKAIGDTNTKSTYALIEYHLSRTISRVFYLPNPKKSVADNKDVFDMSTLMLITHYLHPAVDHYKFLSYATKTRLLYTDRNEVKVKNIFSDRYRDYSRDNKLGFMFFVLPDDEKVVNKYNFSKIFEAIPKYLREEGVKMHIGGYGSSFNYIMAFVTEESMNKILNLDKNVKECVRKNIDYFFVKDIGERYDINRNRAELTIVPAAPGSKPKRVVDHSITDCRTKLVIAPDKYKDTLIITASTFVSADFTRKLERYGRELTLNNLLALTGKKHVASVLKAKIDKLVAQGCTLLTDDLLKPAQKESEQWAFITSNVYSLLSINGYSSSQVSAAIIKANAHNWLFESERVYCSNLQAANIMKPNVHILSSGRDLNARGKQIINLLCAKLVSLLTFEEFSCLSVRRYNSASAVGTFDDLIGEINDNAKLQNKVIKDLVVEAKTNTRGELTKKLTLIKNSVSKKIDEALQFALSRI